MWNTARAAERWTTLRLLMDQEGHLSDIRQIKDWRAPISMTGAYEDLLARIGTASFGPTVRDAVLAVSGARRIYLYEASGCEEDLAEYHFCEPGVEEMFPAYSRHYLRLDPLRAAFSAAPSCSDVAMLRIRPSDISSTAFRRRFFDDAGIIERISIVQRGRSRWGSTSRGTSPTASFRDCARSVR